MRKEPRDEDGAKKREEGIRDKEGKRRNNAKEEKKTKRNRRKG